MPVGRCKLKLISCRRNSLIRWGRMSRLSIVQGVCQLIPIHRLLRSSNGLVMGLSWVILVITRTSSEEDKCHLMCRNSLGLITTDLICRSMILLISCKESFYKDIMMLCKSHIKRLEVSRDKLNSIERKRIKSTIWVLNLPLIKEPAASEQKKKRRSSAKK